LLNEFQDKDSEKLQERMLLQLIVSAAFGMQVMLIYLVQLYPRYAAGEYNNPEVRNLQYLVWALATPVLIVGGLSFITGAWRALRAQTANMDTLVALGTLSAYTYSAYISLTGGGEVYFDSVVMITTFIMLGRYLEALGGGRARKEIRKLLQLQPKKALKKDNESWQEVSAYDLIPGDIILVKPGSRIPADAKVLEGNAAVDESLLTGESVPIEKKEGDDLFAGTIATDSSLTCRVQVSVKETRLAQITKLVEQTLSTKPPIQRLADKASAYFTFIILGTACLTAVGWYVIGQDTSEALLASVAVLVVACPCALGLATPLALTITLGRSAQAGLLIRKNAALEEAAKIDRIVLDKTGTLTQGKMSISATYADEKYISDTSELLSLAASVEQFSEHPIARAIVTASDEPLKEARDFLSQRGAGASALVVDGTARRVLVGSEGYLKIKEGSKFSDEVSLHADQGETVVWVGWDGIIAGFIALTDIPRSSANTMLQELQKEGIDAVMLSGDNPRTTEVVARKLGISHFEGNCPPEEKAARIREWQDGGERIAMVGDGVNDAPALAQADISITVSGGTDVAGEISDVILMHPDLGLIPWFFHLSKRTRRIIIQNLGWAFLYNVVTLPLAALGIISPVIAAVTMASSSLLVVGNSLRLRS
ncbi:MAG: heavy metal translocating P-type ATPase, partial [Anaerolineales bacterium]